MKTPCPGRRRASSDRSLTGRRSGYCFNISRAALLLAVPLAPPLRTASAADAGAACTAASAAIERAARLPPGLLSSIGLVETGRLDPSLGMVTPWPWSVDADGVGHFYLSKEQAVAATSKMQAAGVTSIDVGCMQINLQEHPSAFTSLDAAFDPTANTAYAAKFLWQLYYQTGNWIAAAAAYHSQTPGVSDAYRQAVIAKWRLAGPYRAQLAGASIDPYHVLTATFRRQLLEDVQFRAERDARMFGQAAAPSTVRPFEHLAVGDRSVTR